MATKTAKYAPQASGTRVLITMAQAAAAYDVTLNTLHAWRNGTPTKEQMPVVAKPGGRGVMFDVAKLGKWNKAHGLYFKMLPAAVLATWVEKAKGPAPGSVRAKKPTTVTVTRTLVKNSKPVKMGAPVVAAPGKKRRLHQAAAVA